MTAGEESVQAQDGAPDEVSAEANATPEQADPTPEQADAGPKEADEASPALVPGAPPVLDEAEDRLSSPVELLWDLVFVFAVTQVTTLLARHLDGPGLGHALLVLALVWWAWSAFVWVANAEASDSPALRAALLVALIPIFIAGLTIPTAFSSGAALFAISYAIVRLLHLVEYADASRRGNASWEAIAGFAVTILIGMALLIVGAFLPGTPRVILWILAAAVDYAGPAWLTRGRLRRLQRVAVAHFAERYGLFVIICLGESIVEIGVGAGHRPLTTKLVATVVAGVLITVGMWWTYFDRFAARAEARLREHGDPVLAGADGYSYMHLVIVAGIIVFAAGMRTASTSLGPTLATAPRLALCGGVALYLAGHAAFRWRLSSRVDRAELAAAAAALVVFPLASALPAWGVAALVAAILALLCTWHTRRARPAGTGAASEKVEI